MASYRTYPSRSFYPDHDEMNSAYIPRHTSAESRPDFPGNHLDLGYQPFRSEGPSDSHRPCDSSTGPQCRPAERRMADLELEVLLLKSSLRTQESTQAVSATHIAALTFYLEMANQDMEGVIGAYYTELEHAYVVRCDTAMDNVHQSRSFLQQMRDQSARENFEDLPSQVHRTNFYYHELPGLDEPTGTALKSKSYRVHDLKLPPIPEVLRNQSLHESGQLGQHVERQEVSHLRPIVETSHLELYPEVSAARVPCLHHSLRTSAFLLAPTPPFQPHSPPHEPVSQIYGPCGYASSPASPSYEPASPSYEPASQAYEPASPSYEPASPSYEPASPGNRSFSPVYGASPSSPTNQAASPIHESPSNLLASPFRSPGRVLKPGSLLHRHSIPLRRFSRGMSIRHASEQLQRQMASRPPSPQQPVVGSQKIVHDEDVVWKLATQVQTAADEPQPVPSTSRPNHSHLPNHTLAISSQWNKRKSASQDTGECDSHLGKRIRYY